MTREYSITLNQTAKRAHEMAVKKKFWVGPAGEVSRKLLLIHAEVSEAAEELRRQDGGKARIGEGGKPEGIASEVADVVIRALDLLYYLCPDVEDIVKAKMEYNSTRPDMHGKRF
jgi:NTP pyrophosphatase (non-canonical NTP hydrolase)